MSDTTQFKNATITSIDTQGGSAQAQDDAGTPYTIHARLVTLQPLKVGDRVELRLYHQTVQDMVRLDAPVTR